MSSTDAGQAYLLQIATMAPTGRDEQLAMAQVVQRLPQGFVFIDRKGVVLRANDAFLDLAQLPSEAAALGKNLETLVERSRRRYIGRAQSAAQAWLGAAHGRALGGRVGRRYRYRSRRLGTSRRILGRSAYCSTPSPSRRRSTRSPTERTARTLTSTEAPLDQNPVVFDSGRGAQKDRRCARALRRQPDQRRKISGIELTKSACQIAKIQFRSEISAVGARGRPGSTVP